ncbi:MAG: hypothetical protein UY31_C0008G0013 [Candidatus Wolfebacteria bacterium GW2011_GWE1_48_7]|uniref:Uncharacterized protein n=2 Tax=Candidatus Wolfeibacteriota TaxID=1752735 RepID=A0A0G1WIH3_9BACT|nr:MAG: hypothetical protein UX70_C0001G0679 [Candidatus Wolfebacteria bacterium GW2011_GWB1_47_1]KKU37100.1 MAG: hypothetical protein UX49_C0002G0025 [Candidatus Wolfebacteria bacterium GW2011_GWC2_46_275]KKU42398.1 MAG: hypothetical protein UX58_C0002G0112 [Candidatus Wolfebacteria bacterium GW2011_GWB2_46_69]KKU54364.1 MAG: hypothetical protein UX76_C0003G0060 [Candidatus Wolfebacteria bacterium GW2011_GWC1_47_103]KKU59511.1 MAG: hypothetical protein UX83_C0004G0013 [Candidatus Wolfebacteria
MCVGTATEGYDMEVLLAEYACNQNLIAMIIKVLDQKYADPDWEGDLDIVTEEVAEVFIKAIVITQGSPIHTHLHRATRSTFC